LKSCQALVNANDAIEANLKEGLDRGKLSTNILSHLRNLVEAVFFMLYEQDNHVSAEFEWQNIQKAVAYCKSKPKYKTLYKFHNLLQVSVSHYTLDTNNSERLMLKYYEYLLEIKDLVKLALRIDILSHLHLFPISQDKTFDEYYSKIAFNILKLSRENYYTNFDERFYVEKVKPFFVNNKVFYEVTLSPCNDKRSKFDRLIVFSRFKITDNYAIKARFEDATIPILGFKIPIKIVSNWMVSIRPCEVNNFAKYFRLDTSFKSETKEFYETMKFLTENNLNLYDIATFSDIEYQKTYDYLHSNKRISDAFFNLLTECRKIINRNRPGSNILRYFLYTLKNKIVKTQYSLDENGYLSRLRISYGSIPFDEMPYCSSLINHNPRLSDLFECIPFQDREHELLARKIKNNTEHEARLYTPLAELTQFEDIPSLVKIYNGKIYHKHLGRSLEIDKKQLYISEYETNTMLILKKIISLTTQGIDQYQNSVESWIPEYKSIDDPSKEVIIKTIFSNSSVAVIYGSAGTGKTTLINHIANLFKESKKLFLANTNTAVDNLRKKVNALNCNFSTVAKNIYNSTETDLLIIDESSTVNNADMLKVLTKNKFKLLIVVGDIYQIESISFGNWFGLLKKFISNSCFELYKPFRTNDENLLKLWEIVRNNSETITEHLSKNQYCKNLDNSIFDYGLSDEIVLCLNYDGLYGVNNINRLLQIKNPNNAYLWGIWTYKVGDPIVFNETERFPNTIYNNLKGIITSIKIQDEKIYFEVEIEKALNSFNLDAGLKLIKTSDGKSVIGFHVSKSSNSDGDDAISDSIVPFQISYAVSIHKAQGLEYESVKLIITSEIEENITHNIFYTAITRSRLNLTIYWSPETEQNVINSFSIKNNDKEFGIIQSKLLSL